MWVLWKVAFGQNGGKVSQILGQTNINSNFLESWEVKKQWVLILTQDKNWTPAIITHLFHHGQFLDNIHPKTIQRW